MVQAVTVLIIAALVGIDQLIKYAVVGTLAVGQSGFTIPHFLEILYCQNYGGMMGTFENGATVLAVVTVVILAAGLIVLLSKKIKPGFIYVCLTMIISGGIGNLIDRFRLGYVIDYINVLFVKFYVFNFADCLVTVGAFLLIFYEIYELVRDSKKQKGDNNE